MQICDVLMARCRCACFSPLLVDQNKEMAPSRWTKFKLIYQVQLFAWSTQRRHSLIDLKPSIKSSNLVALPDLF